MSRGTNVKVPREESDLKPTVLFDQIMRWIPIVSVEAVIVIDNSLLLLKRKNQPAKGNGGLLAAG